MANQARLFSNLIKMDEGQVAQNLKQEDQKPIACVQHFFEENNEFYDFAEPSVHQITYDDLKTQEDHDEIFKKAFEIEDYKKFKLDQI